MDKKRGCSTPEYRAVRGHYLQLALNFEPILPRLTAKCFERDLISVNERDAINNKRQPLFDRSTLLLDSLLKKIELDHKRYNVLFSIILRDFPELEDVRCEVNEALILSSMRRKKSVLLLDPSRRHTYSGVPESRSEVDSGVVDIYQPTILYEEGRFLTNSERTMSPPEASTLAIIPDNHRISSTAVENQHLEDKIKQLEEDLSFHHQLSKVQELKVSKQDSIITNLRNDRDQKNKIVQDLESDRAEKEKIIENLKARCEEAEKRATENELTIEGIKKKHKDEIKELQQNIDTLKLKEGDARFELEKARTQLVAAELKKEKELNELRTQYHQQEKLKLELELALSKKEIDVKEREKELAEERIERAREIAEHEATLRSRSEVSERIARAAAEQAEKDCRMSEERERDSEETNARLIKRMEENRQNNKCCVIL